GRCAEHQGAAHAPVRGDRPGDQRDVAGVRGGVEVCRRAARDVHVPRHPARFPQQLHAALQRGGGEAGMGADDRLLQEEPRLMLKGIDHLVVVVPELDAAVASYRGLDFTVVPGGRHPIGTHNALIAFADGSYLELIAFFEPNAQHRWFQRLQQGGGLIDFRLQTDDLAADAGAFRAAGVALADPRPLSRVRPDGYKLSWVLSIPDAHGGVAPFLIEDETPRDERVPRATVHANGVTGIRLVTV